MSPSRWDAAIARLNGHPLQTALWGEARRRADGIESESYAAVAEGSVVWAARVEVRAVPLLGKIAWVPKGPAAIAGPIRTECRRHWLALLRQQGYLLCVVDPWEETHDRSPVEPGVRGQCARTIWIDLSLGTDRLWAGLDKQWRYGVGRARRQGIAVEETRRTEDVEAFFRLCRAVSRSKGFRLPASLALMQALLGPEPGSNSSAHLFAARAGSEIVSGALVLRSGRSIHYFWGATDRAVPGSRAAEATQWAIIEWAIANGCVRYDLEAIDAENNPGVYAFKKRMGGEEIMLSGTRGYALSPVGLLLKSVYGKLPGRRFSL